MADVYPVDPAFAADARVTREQYAALYRESIEHPEQFWGKAAQRLEWFKQPTQVKDVSYALDDFHIRWFGDGELNASVNCLDRQLATRGDKTALLSNPTARTRRRTRSPIASCMSASASLAMRCATWASRKATGSPSICR